MPSFQFHYDVYPDMSTLEPGLQQLILEAREAAMHLSYAPYSGFQVGAALLLDNGDIIKGSNQENASFPAGICAERVALNTAAVLHPRIPVQVLALTYTKTEISEEQLQEVLSPCGICRQVISEVAQQQAQAIRILMCSAGGRIISLPDAKDLLPFSFGSKML